jgi:single stranded DNA-binding protein
MRASNKSEAVSQIGQNQKKNRNMSDINNTVIMGRLTRDPLVRNNGTSMGFFTIACNDRYRDKAGVMQEKVAFVPCKIFGGWTQSLARHKKGDMVVVNGRLRSENWDKENPHLQLVLICDSLQFVTVVPKPQSENSASSGNEGDVAGGQPPF